MAKSKRRRKRTQAHKPKAESGGKIAWGGKASKGTRQLNVVLAVVALAAIAAGAYYLITSLSAEARLLALAAEGRDGLADVVSKRNFGRGHLQAGEAHAYDETFPTSGPHPTTWTTTGFYDAAPEPGLLVHALEHGNIVIYYDKPGDEVMATIEEWVGLYGGQWDGLIAAPKAGLGDQVVLTAWIKELRLDPFDPALAAAFIDAYRGRGPENPVR